MTAREFRCKLEDARAALQAVRRYMDHAEQRAGQDKHKAAEIRQALLRCEELSVALESLELPA